MTQYPLIDLYDDISDPHDWALLTQAVQRSNPRSNASLGDPSLVPPDRILTGHGASWVMGAFTHASTDRPSRFSRGDYGVYYAGNSLETALYEHSFHIGRFFAATHEASGWKSKVRQLVGAIDADLSDIRSGNWEAALDPEPENWGPAQTLAATLREEGSNGLVYPSVRHSTGECIAVFWPDVVTPATQADHYRYHWNGTRIDYVQRVTGDRQTFAMG